MGRISIIAVCLLLVSVLSPPLIAQTASPPEQPQPVIVPPAEKVGVVEVLTDVNNLAPATFLLSNIADAKTDWKFVGPITKKDYTITPATRLGFAGGSIFVAYTIRHYYPKTAKPINLAFAVATAYFAGRAYANTFNHSTPMPVVATPGATTSAMRGFRLR